MSNGGGGNPMGVGDENPRGGGGENTMGTSGGNPRGYGGRGPRGCRGESPRGYSNSKPTGTVEGWVAAAVMTATEGWVVTAAIRTKAMAGWEFVPKTEFQERGGVEEKGDRIQDCGEVEEKGGGIHDCEGRMSVGFKIVGKWRRVIYNQTT
uniref:Uncharacterized protein n=1 Tax=Oryza glumipatula TaxID=40148 RepID=A0A0D9ZVX3_9ORYZ